jgi:hypothetical protein
MTSDDEGRNDQTSGKEAEEYEVEKILGRLTTNGQTLYHIKWKGYPDSANSWEPEENCGCPVTISSLTESPTKSQVALEKLEKIRHYRFDNPILRTWNSCVTVSHQLHLHSVEMNI